MQGLFAGIMKPRKDCKIITTEHFDIIFSPESEETAYLIAQYTEDFFNRALNFFPNQHYLRIMVIISADSEEMSCEYTPLPYNRIIVYQGAQLDTFREEILALYNHEVLEAVARNTRNNFWNFLSQNMIGDFLQPISLFNIPESYIQGYVNSVQAKIMNINPVKKFSDSQALEILAKAKKRGDLLSLQQLSIPQDSYDKEELKILLADSFCYYIQSTYGIDVFLDYWKQCGEFNFGRLNEGIFKKVYGIPLIHVWESFIDTIPEPENLEERDEDLLRKIVKNNDTSFEHILKTQEGYIWFNRLKGQVESINLETDKKPQILFFADNITKLEFSENKEYLFVYRTQQMAHPNYKNRYIHVYDVKNAKLRARPFLEKNGLPYVDSQGNIIQIPKIKDDLKLVDPFSNNYLVKDYNPFKYLFDFSWNLFMPIKEISVKEGAINWLGLGFQMQSKSDPMSNHIFGLSASAGFMQHEIIHYLSPSNFTISFLQNAYDNFNFNYAFSAYYENTASPVMLDVISHFRFSPEGAYNLTAYGGAFYKTPLSMEFQKLSIDLKALYEFSTTYIDENHEDLFPELKGWSNLFDSYQNLQANLTLIYSSIRNYGSSPYKKTGIKMGIELFSMWNVSVKKLEQKNKENNNTFDTNMTFSQAIYDQMWNGFFAPTQLNLGLFGKLEIPSILPFNDVSSWIFSLPTSFYCDLFYTKGVSFQVDTKVLLVGNELQNGIRPLNFYVNRFGLYMGYKFILSYDDSRTGIPDLREFKRYQYIFQGNYIDDWIYFEFDLQYTITAGILCNYLVGTSLIFEKSLKNQEFDFKLNFKFTEK